MESDNITEISEKPRNIDELYPPYRGLNILAEPAKPLQINPNLFTLKQKILKYLCCIEPSIHF